MSSATLWPCVCCTQVLSSAHTRRDQIEVLSSATKKVEKKSKENQKLNLTSNISEIGNPKKLTWPSFSWYFCHSIWEVPHGSGSFSPSCWSKAAMSWWQLLSLGHAHSGSQDSPNNTSHPIIPKQNWYTPKNIKNQDFYGLFPPQIWALKTSEPWYPKDSPWE